MTKKELKKEVRLTIVREVENLKQLINQSVSGEVKESLLFSVAKIISLAKSHAEVLRLVELVCFCGKNEERDTYFKNLLYRETSKIYENIKLKS